MQVSRDQRADVDAVRVQEGHEERAATVVPDVDLLA
jgi:hypothetical protein